MKDLLIVNLKLETFV